MVPGVVSAVTWGRISGAIFFAVTVYSPGLNWLVKTVKLGYSYSYLPLAR